MSTQVSLAIIAICMLVITVGTLVLTVPLIMLALSARKSLATITNKTQPLISQVEETVKTANGIAHTVKVRAEGIMDKAETTVDSVSKKVRTTSNIVQQTISPPIISVASLITGISKGLEFFREYQSRKGTSHAHGES